MNSNNQNVPPIQTVELTSKKYKRAMVVGGTATLFGLGVFIIASVLKNPFLGWIGIGLFVIGIIWYSIARTRAWWHHG
jgi:hypothetical protein